MRIGSRALVAAMLWGCAKKPPSPPPPPPAPPAVEVLTRLLEGRFDSMAQAAENPAYYGVQLDVCAIAAPELGARVLYVEQALMKRLEAPYRQRLYVLEAGEPPATRALSRVYELKDPKAAVGYCTKHQPLAVGAADVVERAGCTVALRLEGDRLLGGTTGKACPSELNGAAYATTDVVLSASAIESWDRGFAADGTQVWGAETGPYTFERRSPLSP